MDDLALSPDAARWSPDRGWAEPEPAEFAEYDDQVLLVLGDEFGPIESVLLHRRPWVSPLAEPLGCLVLFSGECAGGTLAWMHGGITLGEDGGWWDGDEELIGCARRLRARVPDDPCAIAFVISMICNPVEDITAVFADEYRERHGDQIGAVTVNAALDLPAG